ncbi:MAG: DUF2795 domain-containing protein [Ignavibacteriales bacterium]
MARGMSGQSPVNITQHLKGLDFPANKNRIISFCRENHSPGNDQVLSILERIPDKNYNSPADVMKEVGHVE